MQSPNSLLDRAASAEKPNLPVCILAGGASLRFGSPKGLAELNGTTLLDLVLSRLRAQTSGEIFLNAVPDGPYANCGLPIIGDTIAEGIGPLAGLHAAMDWGRQRGAEAVVTCSVDTPFIPANLLSQLCEAKAPVICASQGNRHPVIGLWPCKLTSQLEEAIRNGMRSAHAWAEASDVSIASFPVPETGQDPFLNINTIQDLQNAHQ